MKKLMFVLTVALAGTAVVACEPATPADARVFVLGDSLVSEVMGSPEAKAMFGSYRMDYSGVRFGGVPCNGIPKAKQLKYRPDVVVIAYSGNRRSDSGNCMNGETGQNLANRYFSDHEKLIEHFTNGHTKVVVIGAPARHPEVETQKVFDSVALAAWHAKVQWVDSSPQISPNRVIALTMPCLPEEPVCGTDRPGRNIVRSTDRTHFCSYQLRLSGSCGAYNSGAVRYAKVMNEAIGKARIARR